MRITVEVPVTLEITYGDQDTLFSTTPDKMFKEVRKICENISDVTDGVAVIHPTRQWFRENI